jgi:hypothetical protein
MTDNPTFTAWITKYALTTGIKQIEARRCLTANRDMIEDVGTRFCVLYHGEGREWHCSRAGAVVRAKELRTAKINSLHKQIAKLEAMLFE